MKLFLHLIITLYPLIIPLILEPSLGANKYFWWSFVVFALIVIFNRVLESKKTPDLERDDILEILEGFYSRIAQEVHKYGPISFSIIIWVPVFSLKPAKGKFFRTCFKVSYHKDYRSDLAESWFVAGGVAKLVFVGKQCEFLDKGQLNHSYLKGTGLSAQEASAMLSSCPSGILGVPMNDRQGNPRAVLQLESNDTGCEQIFSEKTLQEFLKKEAVCISSLVIR